MSICFVRQCKNVRKVRSHSESLPFFRFPRDPERFKEWLELIGRGDEDIRWGENLAICSAHFRECDVKHGEKRSRLVDGACPIKIERSIQTPWRPKVLHNPFIFERTLQKCSLRTNKTPSQKKVAIQRKRRPPTPPVDPLLPIVNIKTEDPLAIPEIDESGEVMNDHAYSSLSCGTEEIFVEPQPSSPNKVLEGDLSANNLLFGGVKKELNDEDDPLSIVENENWEVFPDRVKKDHTYSVSLEKVAKQLDTVKLENVYLLNKLNTLQQQMKRLSRQVRELQDGVSGVSVKKRRK